MKMLGREIFECVCLDQGIIQIPNVAKMIPRACRRKNLHHQGFQLKRVIVTGVIIKMLVFSL